MLIDFFYRLRQGGVPVSLTEHLTLLEGLHQGNAITDVDSFYYFARMILVKDERYYDRFDRIFADYVKGREQLFDALTGDVPLEWLKAQALLNLTEEEKREIESAGGWDELMKLLADRLNDQQERHEGGNKWIGTAGRSPFGAFGYNPEGVRIGQHQRRQGRAVKVWDRREFKNLDDSRELGTRNLKVALRKLRRFARDGAPEHLDLENTITSTAKNAGLLDLKLKASRRNTIKLLLFLDVGGSMDYHATLSEELFSAARAEFKSLDYFYFHNFIYEGVWKDNQRRRSDILPTNELIRTYGADHKIIIVGDATMSPYEIAIAGGSVEHWNEEAGATWLQRLASHFEHMVWLNPEPQAYWQRTQSIMMTQELMEQRMYSLNVDGITRAIRTLQTGHHQHQ